MFKTASQLLQEATKEAEAKKSEKIKVQCNSESEVVAKEHLESMQRSVVG